MADDRNALKRLAAWRAVEEIRSGMTLGLGHGSTAAHALQRIGQLLDRGALERIQGVPCSLEVEKEALVLGIPLTTLDEHPVLDLTIDGADEADEELRLIKGGGGALLREKIVAQASRREIIVVDEGKLSARLGEKQALPVEVLPFGWRSQAEYLCLLGGNWKLRLQSSGEPYRTDQGNYILDCLFGPMAEPEALSKALSARAGIVEHGLFIGLASQMIVAGSQGLRILNKDVESITRG